MASVLPHAPVLEPGFRLDRYELLCRIGQGGMATVWLARTANSHGEERLVAIKTILPGLAGDDTLRTMLLDEARIATAIDHPNVARTLEVGQLWDMPYLVLELVEGESVDQLCKSLGELSLTVPAAVVVRIVADAALGLHEAHELTSPGGENLGIVHRDVAPANILVDELGCARVIDFGVAKATERFTPETAVGVMKGRVPYMAPEHASGGEVDRRSDIWSLGAVAYFMLAGRYPFDGGNDAARLIRILGTDGPDPLPDSVAPAVRDVVLRALSKDPDGRYATAAELASALEISKLPATHKEVATFFQETLAAPIRARRALLENALAAADARARAREMLDGPPPAGSSMSYRPPPVIADDDGRASGNGTLGTVTRSPVPPTNQWVPWVTAAVIGLIVMVAFALGSVTARAPSGATASTPPTGTVTTARAVSTGTAVPQGTTVAAETHATPAVEAPAVTADPTVDAGTKTTSATPAKTVPPWATWPPPATTKGASSTVKPSNKPPHKPAEHEDTIF
jgi:eukaryotic-like serine/threonine-protein kinase